MFSLLALGTFNDLPEMRDQLLRVKDVDFVPSVLVGINAEYTDEIRVVTKEQEQNLANKWGCPFLEVSIKMQVNVNEAFEAIVREIMKQRQKNLCL